MGKLRQGEESGEKKMKTTGRALSRYIIGYLQYLITIGCEGVPLFVGTIWTDDIIKSGSDTLRILSVGGKLQLQYTSARSKSCVSVSGRIWADVPDAAQVLL